MNRAEFNQKFGSTFFIKANKWGKQLTNEEAAKLGYTVTNTPAAKTTKASGISALKSIK